jgi:thioredoxin-related protein
MRYVAGNGAGVFGHIRVLPDHGKERKMSEQQDIIDGLIQECLESDEGLDCLVDAFEKMPTGEGLCKPQLVMLTSPDCPHCEDMKAHHSTLLSTGVAEEVLAESWRGSAISQQEGVFGTPSLLLLDCKDQLIGEIYSDAELDAV